MSRTTRQLPILLTITALLLATPFVTHADSSWFADSLWSLVNMVFGLFLWFGGMLLNVGINSYVIGFGSEFSETGVGGAVNLLWTIMRDIFNLTFIFGLIYLGFKMILNSDDSNTRRWLVSLIIAALLVNFSLYITKVIVDFTNILAAQIVYNGFGQDSNNEVLVSDTFASFMGVHTVWSGLPENVSKGTSGAQYGYIFGTAIVFMVAGFVFAAGGIMLIIRFVVLCLYMVFSPLMFLGSVLPQLQGVTRDYWRGFLGRAFFAPVYLLLIYFSAIVLGAFYSDKPHPQFEEAFTKGATSSLDFNATLATFVVSIIFLVASLVVGQKLGAQGASTAVGMLRSTKDKTQRYVVQRMQRTARTARDVATYAPRRGLRLASDKTGQFMERTLNAAQKADSKLVAGIASTNLVNRGVRGAAKSAQEAKFGAAYTRAEERRQKDTTVNRADNARKRDAEVQNIIDAQNAREAAKQAGNATAEADAIKEEREARSRLEGHVKKTSNEELIAMDQAQLKEISGYLTDAQIKAVEESGRHRASGDKNAIKDLKETREQERMALDRSVLEQTNASAKDLGDSLDNLGKLVRSLSVEQKQNTSLNTLADPRFAMHLTENDLEGIQEKYGVSGADRVRASRTAALTAKASGNLTGNLKNPDGTDLKDADGNVVGSLMNSSNKNITANFKEEQRQKLMTGNIKQVGSLPAEVFMNPDMAEYITPQALEERQRNGLEGAEIAAIRDNIDNFIKDLRSLPGYPSTYSDKVEKQWTEWSNKTRGSWLGLTSV